MKLRPILMLSLFLGLSSAVLFPENFAQAQTKELYGIEGAKLEYQKPVKRKYTYKVRGKTYKTKTHDEVKNYSQEGIASYYGHPFDGRLTANGEIYDSSLYTAAHKTLPLPSYAVVTNLKNQRKVIVKINDRGPFIGNRLIDLSVAAAKELGIVHSGLGRVKVEVLHVLPNGKISGAGAKTLAKTVKTGKGRQTLAGYKIAKQDVAKNVIPEEEILKSK